MSVPSENTAEDSDKLVPITESFRALARSSDTNGFRPVSATEPTSAPFLETTNVPVAKMPAREMTDSELAAMLHREMNSSRRVTAARGKTAAAFSTLVDRTASARARQRVPSGSRASGTDKLESESESESDSDQENSQLEETVPPAAADSVQRDSPAMTSTKDLSGSRSRKNPSSEGVATSQRSSDDSKREDKTGSNQPSPSEDGLALQASGQPLPGSLFPGDWKVDKSGRPTTTAGRQALKDWKEKLVTEPGKALPSATSNPVSSYSYKSNNSPQGSECGLADSQRPVSKEDPESAPAAEDKPDVKAEVPHQPSAVDETKPAIDRSDAPVLDAVAHKDGDDTAKLASALTQQPGSGKNFTQLFPPIPAENLKACSFKLPESVRRHAAIYMRVTAADGQGQPNSHSRKQPPLDPNRSRARPPRPKQTGDKTKGSSAVDPDDGASSLGSDSETAEQGREVESSAKAKAKSDEDLARELHQLLNEGRSSRRAASSQGAAQPAAKSAGRKERSPTASASTSEGETDSDEEGGSDNERSREKAGSARARKGLARDDEPGAKRRRPGGGSAAGGGPSGRSRSPEEPPSAAAQPSAPAAAPAGGKVGSEGHEGERGHKGARDDAEQKLKAKQKERADTSPPEAATKGPPKHPPAPIGKKPGLPSAFGGLPSAFRGSLPSAFNTPLQKGKAAAAGGAAGGGKEARTAAPKAGQPPPPPARSPPAEPADSPPSPRAAVSAAPPRPSASVLSPTTAAARHAEMAARAFAAAGISPPPATERAMRAAAAEEERRSKAKAAAAKEAKEAKAGKAAAKEAKEAAAREEAEADAAAKARAFADVAAKLKAEAAARAQRDAEEKDRADTAAAKAKAEADTKRKVEAALKAKAEAAARVKAEAAAQAEAERKAKAEADRKAKAEAERKAKAEAERKAKLEAERKAKLEAERKAKLEAERKAKLEAERKAKLEAERKAKAEADARAKAEAERRAKVKAEAERKLKGELAARAEADAAARAKAEADMRVKVEQVAARAVAEAAARVGAEAAAKAKAALEHAARLQGPGAPEAGALDRTLKRSREAAAPAAAPPPAANGNGPGQLGACYPVKKHKLVHGEAGANGKGAGGPQQRVGNGSGGGGGEEKERGRSSVYCTVGVAAPGLESYAKALRSEPVKASAGSAGLSKSAMPLKKRFLMSMETEELAPPPKEPKWEAAGSGPRAAEQGSSTGGGFSKTGLVMRGLEALAGGGIGDGWLTHSAAPPRGHEAEAACGNGGGGQGVRTGRRKPNRGAAGPRRGVWGEGLGLAYTPGAREGNGSDPGLY